MTFVEGKSALSKFLKGFDSLISINRIIKLSFIMYVVATFLVLDKYGLILNSRNMYYANMYIQSVKDLISQIVFVYTFIKTDVFSFYELSSTIKEQRQAIELLNNELYSSRVINSQLEAQKQILEHQLYSQRVVTASPDWYMVGLNAMQALYMGWNIYSYFNGSNQTGFDPHSKQLIRSIFAIITPRNGSNNLTAEGTNLPLNAPNLDAFSNVGVMDEISRIDGI